MVSWVKMKRFVSHFLVKVVLVLTEKQFLFCIFEKGNSSNIRTEELQQKYRLQDDLNIKTDFKEKLKKIKG